MRAVLSLRTPLPPAEPRRSQTGGVAFGSADVPGPGSNPTRVIPFVLLCPYTRSMKRGSPLSDEMRARMRRYEGGHKYRLAIDCEISPSTFSAWTNGVYSPSLGDRRALKLARVLGVPADQVWARKGAPAGGAA